MKRFLILTLSAASLLFAVLVTGCNNIVENEVESESPASVTEIKTKTTEPETIVTVSGSLNIRGAFPEEIVNQLNHVIPNTRHAELVSASDRSRTAFPSVPETGLTAEIKAVKVSDSSVTYDATSIDWEHRTFTIGVPVGSSEVSYKITADIKYADKIILSGESEDFSISSENPLVDASLTLGAKKTVTGSTNTNGKGNISLEIEIEDDSEISYCKIKIQEGLFYNKNGGPYNVSDGKILITETDVYSYNATVEFKFYSTSDALLYSFTESVSIFDNLTTNTWVKNGNEPWLVTSGTETICRITNAMIEGYKLTEIWVDETRSIDEMEDNYTSESGTFLNPKVSLSSALSMLNNATKDYTIFIKGTLTGSQMIPESLKKTGSGGGYTYAKSLTICGDTGLDNSGLPQDELKVTGTGTVLTIYTNVPVIIKNLKITGGKQSTESGGGIYINNSEANVYLTNGALITGNQAKVGGGAYVAQGNLFVYGSAVIGKSGVSSHAEDSENSFGNKATTSGGGIGIGSGTLWLGYSSENVPAETSGGVIYNLVKGSAETHGGGIDNQNGTINIAAGLVSYNYACCDEDSTHTGRGGGISTARNAYLSGTAVIEENYADLGGGFYITKDTYNGYLEMSGGTIRSNHAVKERPGVAECYGDGGGVAIGNDASFTMSGGIISSNTADDKGNGIAIANGYLKMKGNASVDSNNDVFLASEKYIEITDALTATSSVATVTLDEYTIGRRLLFTEDDSGVTLANEVGKFVLTQNAAEPETVWEISRQGMLIKELDAEDLNSTSYDIIEKIKVTSATGMTKLIELAGITNAKNFEGKTITLAANVELSEGQNFFAEFKGTFNGNGKTISGMSGVPALFSRLNGATVKDLIVEGSSTIAGIASSMKDGLIEGCISRVNVNQTGTNTCGGIVGIINDYNTINPTVRNCINEGTIKSSSGTLGGIAGNGNSAYSIIDSCVNKGTVESTGSGSTLIGGIVGQAFGVVRNCINTGNVIGGSGTQVGGITGVEMHYGYISRNGVYNCANLAPVSGKYQVGGIAGVYDIHATGLNYSATIKNCFNAGSVTITDNTKTSVGGIVGEFLLGGSGSCILANNYYKTGTAASGIGADNGETVEAPSAMVPSIYQMNEWVNANNSGELYKNWTLKVVDGVTLPVPDVGYEW